MGVKHQLKCHNTFELHQSVYDKGRGYVAFYFEGSLSIPDQNLEPWPNLCQTIVLLHIVSILDKKSAGALY